jgi:hypothetical protein
MAKDNVQHDFMSFLFFQSVRVPVDSATQDDTEKRLERLHKPLARL